MKVVKAEIEDIEKLKPVAIEWRETCSNDFELDLDPETYFKNLAGLIENDNSELFLLMKKDRVVGYIGALIFDSPLGNQIICSEATGTFQENIEDAEPYYSLGQSKNGRKRGGAVT